MKETRVLVVGAAGQLGTALQYRKFALGNKVFFTDVVEGYDYLNCKDYESVLQFLKENNITHVVNCAAYTNVPKAETDKEVCESLNVEIPRMLSFACNAVDATLIHVSSDYVYSGVLNKTTPFKEEDVDFSMQSRVKGVYGRSKLGGDQAVWNNCKKFFILRTSWLYYEGFESAFPAKIINKLKGNEQLKVVFDQIGTPTYAGDLADAITMLVSTNRHEYGVYNFSDVGVCSWYDFAQEIRDLYKEKFCLLKNIPDILPIRYEDNIRPYYSVMDKTKFMETFAYPIPYWKDSLKKYFDNYARLR